MHNRETLALLAILRDKRTKWSDLRMKLEERVGTTLLERASTPHSWRTPSATPKQ